MENERQNKRNAGADIVELLDELVDIGKDTVGSIIVPGYFLNIIRKEHKKGGGNPMSNAINKNKLMTTISYVNGIGITAAQLLAYYNLALEPLYKTITN